MTIEIFAHPFSSYCMKAIMAFYEKDVPWTLRMLSPENPENNEEHGRRWPIRRFPLMVADGEQVMEATAIIEWLEAHHAGGPRLIPADAKEAVRVRMMDRIFDNYVMTPQGRCVFDALRPEDARDPYGVAEAQKLLDTSYEWLDGELAGRQWAAGDEFSMADCAAAPALLYADWTYEITARFKTLRAYRQRLIERPSFARALDEARPFRHLFPLGAPADRD